MYIKANFVSIYNQPTLGAILSGALFVIQLIDGMLWN